MFRLDIPSPGSLEIAARNLLEAFPDKRIFAFYGEMGAGKTTFIKAACRVLQVSNGTSSPSFGLIHEYRSSAGAPVYHFDFFRIESLEEILDIGYEDYFFSGSYCFIEWPELAEPILPPETIRLELLAEQDGKRKIRELE